jgi:alpha-ketoglutarate-dependent 2,4-dichlorophenoxyacetate dioxygenase
MATPELRPLGKALGTEATGIDLSKLDDDTFDWIKQAFAEHPVLVFRNQKLGAGDIAAFGHRFGTPRIHSLVSYRHEEYPEVSWLRNVDADGNIDWYGVKRATDWHTDSTYEEVPPLLAMLHALEIPASKGGTMFADMRAAYDALDERTKTEIEDLVCEHSLIYSREAIGFTDLAPEEIAAFRPVRQRLVRTHPETGRKSLFLSSHAGAIVGWTIPEGRMFLRDLTEHATAPAFVYSHSWRPHDLVMWDNRATMHRARRFDRAEVRDVRRTTLAGETGTIEQAA